MPDNKPVRYHHQIAEGYRPPQPAPAKFKCGGAVDKTKFQNYGNGFRKIKPK